MIKRQLLATVILVVWGFLKMPWESALENKQNALTLGSSAPVSMEIRDKLGQGLTLAALGGFRGLAATAAWLLLQSAWEKGDWAWVRSYIEMGVLLQPRDVFYWDNGSWQLAFNASIDAQNSKDKSLTPEEHRAESRRWVDEGIQLLERGIRANPDDPLLYQTLASTYERRLGDFRQAAHYYELATQKPGCPPFLLRFPGYALQNAGEDQQAYDYWKRIWPKLSDQEKTSLQWQRARDEIKKLEEKLNVPRQDRIIAI